MEQYERNYRAIKSEIKEAKLIAVSKNQTVEDIKKLRELGLEDFGENRVQEFLAKYQRLPDINWHFIGQLQTNKVKYLVGKISLIQSLDSIKLAAEIDKQSVNKKQTSSCLIQLKFDEEKQRGGCELKKLPELYDYCHRCNNLKVEGFMLVAPFGLEPQELAIIFNKAREIYLLYQKKDPAIVTLSMGMSDDYQLALNYGANMIRIGQKLFTKN